MPDRGTEERPPGGFPVPDYWMGDDFDDPLPDVEADFDPR